jgi:hypothetical protein
MLEFGSSSFAFGRGTWVVEAMDAAIVAAAAVVVPGGDVVRWYTESAVVGEAALAIWAACLVVVRWDCKWAGLEYNCTFLAADLASVGLAAGSGV